MDRLHDWSKLDSETVEVRRRTIELLEEIERMPEMIKRRCAAVRRAAPTFSGEPARMRSLVAELKPCRRPLRRRLWAVRREHWGTLVLWAFERTLKRTGAALRSKLSGDGNHTR